MINRKLVSSTILATLVVLSTVAAVAFVGAGAIALGTQQATADHDSPGNYTVELPNEDDHLPGDENPGGASIQHFAALEGVFESADGFAEADFLIVSSEEVDFSACDTDDTEAFGIDRGNNNDGTQTDDDLVQHRLDSQFTEDELIVEFYDEEDIGGDPPEINVEDAIVAVQTSCYTMPEEEGWYQIDGFLNGTTHDGEFKEVELTSHYFPVCDGCHDEETAEDRLGPSPAQEESEAGNDGGAEPTPTPTEEPENEPTPTEEPESEPTPTEEPENEPTPTEEPENEPTPTEEPQSDDSAASEERANGNDDAAGADDTESTLETPTVGDGAGFGALAAFVALVSGVAIARLRA